jgi:hypothetical protein
VIHPILLWPAKPNAETSDRPPDSSTANMTSAAENSLGRPNFVALTGPDSPERQERLARILARIDEEKLEVVRVACVDTHGQIAGFADQAN